MKFNSREKADREKAEKLGRSLWEKRAKSPSFLSAMQARDTQIHAGIVR
jgi:hypothetical protein